MSTFNALEHTEALVQCKRCKTTKWVEYKYRHAGEHYGNDGYTYARCSPCPNQEDMTKWTGQIRVRYIEQDHEYDSPAFGWWGMGI